MTWLCQPLRRPGSGAGLGGGGGGSKIEKFMKQKERGRGGDIKKEIYEIKPPNYPHKPALFTKELLGGMVLSQAAQRKHF